MRDKRFITERRGGVLTGEQHRQLVQWACECAGHIIPLISGEPDERLKDAIRVAQDWKNGNASVGDARKASLGAIAAAIESEDLVSAAVARSVGHTVATAHMADHALRAALYALKAIKIAGKSADEERKWQNEHLAEEISELILTYRILKEKVLKIS